MTYNFDLIVIGAGSGGVRASRILSNKGINVAIIEETFMGGTCVNVGCVPKKLFTYASKFASDFKYCSGYGFNLEKTSFDWKTLVNNKNKEIKRLNNIYNRILTESNVTIINGFAKFKNKHTIIVNNKEYTAKKILIACGSTPYIPDIEGAELGCTSFDMFYLEKLPKNIIIVGSGYIGLEFASILNNLGCNVTVTVRKNKILTGFDIDIQEFLSKQLKTKGINILFQTQPIKLTKNNNRIIYHTNNNRELETDFVLFATSRIPNTKNLGLENISVPTDNKGAITVNDNFQTKCDNVYAIGDVLNRVKLTPVALREAMVFVNRNYGDKTEKMSYKNIPAAVFCNPEIGTCGLTEQQAIQQEYNIQIFKSEFLPMKNTLSKNPIRSLVKLIVDKTTDKILGAHMVGDDSAEIMQGISIALKAELTKKDFDTTIGIHPSSAEEFVTMRTPIK